MRFFGSAVGFLIFQILCLFVLMVFYTVCEYLKLPNSQLIIEQALKAAIIVHFLTIFAIGFYKSV